MLCGSTTADAAAERSAAAVLEACAARLDVERDIGVARVFDACPEVASAFESELVRPWLPLEWRTHGEDLSAGSLRELASLLREAQAAPAGGTAPDRALLAAVIAENSHWSRAGPGLWQRMLAWLRATAGRTPSEPQGVAFVDWLRSVEGAQRFWTLTGYAAFALTLLFALWVIGGELRALRKALRRTASAATAFSATFGRAAAPVDANDVPLVERPSLLLARVVAALAERAGLLRSEAQTVDELLAAHPFADVERAARLALLARVAEAVRYAPAPPDAQTLREATRAGESLLDAVGVRAS